METAKKTRNTPSLAIDAEIGKRAHMLIWSERRKQGDVAAEIGMSSGSLGLKLKGQRGWAVSELVSLAAALNTTVGYLVGETEESPSDPRNLVPKVGGSNPSGGTLVSFPLRETPHVERERLAPVTSITGERVA